MKKILIGTVLSLVLVSGVYAQDFNLKALGDFFAPTVASRTALTNLVPAGSLVYDATNGSAGFYGLSPAGSWIPLGLTPTASRSEVMLSGGSGLGSTNTSVRRFSNSLISTGSGITYTNSAVNGDTFTVNDAGMYSITYQDSSTTDGGMVFGITRNSTQLTTGPSGITDANLLATGIVSAVNRTSTCTTTVFLAAGDVIRAQAESGANDTTTYKVRFHIAKVTD